MVNRLHAYKVFQRRGSHTRDVWYVASTATKLPIARKLAGPNPNPKAAPDYKGPMRKGAVAYGPWVKDIDF